MLPVLATRESSSSTISYHHPAASFSSLNSLASAYASDDEDNEDDNQTPVTTTTSITSTHNMTTGMATGTWTHSVTHLLQPQNWTLQMQLGLAVAFVAPCAAVSLKVGAVVLTGIACLPKVMSLYHPSPSTTPTPTQTNTQTHTQHGVPPRKGKYTVHFSMRSSHETPQQDLLRLPPPPPAPSDEFLKVKLQWVQDHEWELRIQEECPLAWLVKNSAAEPEKTHYKQHIEYYDVQITRFHCAQKEAMNIFENFLHSQTTTDLSPKQFAKECWSQSQVLDQTLLNLIKKLYKELLDLRNQHTDGVTHPCLTEKINHAFDQAAFNYLSIQFTLEQRVGHLTNLTNLTNRTTSALHNKENISRSPSPISTQPLTCWCIQSIQSQSS